MGLSNLYTTNYLLGGSSETSTLTASYEDNTTGILNIEGARNVMLYVTYTPKAGQTNRVLYMQVETGPDEADMHLLTIEEDTATSGLTESQDYTKSYTGATGGVEYKRSFALGDIIAVGMRVSFKESGTDDFGTAKLRILHDA